MKLFQFSFITILILTCLTSYGQLEAPKYSNEFLNLGVGAHAFGMSNSVVAQTKNVTAAYWNPAGLASLENDMEVEVMHAEYFAGIANYDYVGFAKKVKENDVLGVSIIRFGVDNILNTTELIDGNGNVDYDRIKLFSAADYAFIFSYAKKSKIEGLSYGANAKVIHRLLGDFAKSWGFGFDLSAQYTKGKWSFGAVGKDITSTFNAWNYDIDQNVIDVFERTGNEIPENAIEVTLPKVVLGMAREFTINDKINVTTELDFDMYFDGERNSVVSLSFLSLDPHFGFNAGYQNTVFLRGGVGNIQNQQNFNGEESLTFQPNIGIGLRIRNFFLDYALSDIGNQSIALNSNIFSLRMEM